MAIQKRSTAKGQVRWVARYRDRAGKERSASFDTRKEAKSHIEEQQTAMRHGMWVDPAMSRVTVGELVRKWAKRPAKDGTARNREFLAANLGRLDHMPINAVKPSDLSEWTETLLHGRPWMDGKKLSRTTVANMTGWLAGVFKIAMDDNLIPRMPRFSAPKASKNTPSRADIYTEAEIRALIKHARKDYPRSPARPWLELMIIIAVGTGMRISEICGVRVENFDRLHKEVHVVAQADENGDALVELKSEKSQRSIPTPDFVFDAVDEYLVKFPRKSGESLFFRVVDGREKMFSKHAAGHALARLQGVHGLRRKSFHDFRHYYASGLIDAGVPVVAVQEALGHASAQMTLNTYTHFWPGQADVTRAAAAARGGFLRDDSGIDDANTDDSGDGLSGSLQVVG